MKHLLSLFCICAAALLCAACNTGGDGGGNTQTDTGSTADTGNTTNTQPDTGSTAVTEADTSGGTDTTITPTCAYPANDGFIQMGKIMPHLTWKKAYLGDGTPLENFSLEDVFCDEAYSQYNAVFFFVTAEWCHACTEMLTGSKDNGLFTTIDDAGGLIINLEVETTEYAPSTSDEAFATISSHAGAPPGIIAGDGDTDPASVPSVIMSSSLIGSFPGGFIVRKSDMRVISLLSDSENRYYDLPAIAADPDSYWDGSVPSDEPHCFAADEEPSEPANNTFAGASTLVLNESLFGGICDDEPDFYRVTYPGTWAIELTFDRAEGDLDFWLWDTETDNFLLDAAGRRIGSAGLSSNEFFSFNGPATIKIFGYTGNTAKYRVTLVPLDN